MEIPWVFPALKGHCVNLQLREKGVFQRWVAFMPPSRTVLVNGMNCVCLRARDIFRVTDANNVGRAMRCLMA